MLAESKRSLRPPKDLRLWSSVGGVMQRSLLCEIVTPERIVYAGEARMVVVPTVDGEIGILPLHAPIVAILRPGEVRVRYDDDEVEWFAVAGGYVQVCDDKVIILADQAVLSSTIDAERARQALEITKGRLQELHDEDLSGLDSCQADLKWCELQVEVAGKGRT